MKVFLDDREITSAESTLGGALDACRVAAESSGRLIVEVWADGERTPDDDLTDPPTFSPYADEIRMVSADPSSLVATTMLEASDVMGEMSGRQQLVAEHLQVGRTSEALAALGDLLSVWDGVRKAVVEGCAIVGADPVSLLPASQQGAYTSAAERLTISLTELRDMMRAQDLSGVADVLEGDLADEAPRWQELLSVLADGVMQAGAKQ